MEMLDERATGRFAWVSNDANNSMHAYEVTNRRADRRAFELGVTNRR